MGSEKKTQRRCGLLPGAVSEEADGEGNTSAYKQ